MDPFVVITFGSILLALGAILLLGMSAPQRFVTEVLNRREHERWATQLEIEEHELPEMLAAANEYRRKHDMPAVTIEHFRGKAGHQQRALIRQAEKHARSKADEMLARSPRKT